MLLSDTRILEEMQKGNIIISPFYPHRLGTNSYDCTLGPWYYQGNKNLKEIYLDTPFDLMAYWGKPREAQMGDVRAYIKIEPHATILAHTQEEIGGRNGFLATMHSKSTAAREGLSVCRCAGVGDVGYVSRWTMEICNHTDATIHLPVGMRICQMLFHEVGPTLKEYKGKYGQKEWTPEDMLPKIGG
jgi:dCTP deaminase